MGLLAAPQMLPPARPAPRVSPPALALPLARLALPAPLPPQLAQRFARNALAATRALRAPLHGPSSTAAGATTAQTALVPQRPAPTKCPRRAGGARCKFKAPLSSWTLPTASITASGAKPRATACLVGARGPQITYIFWHTRCTHRVTHPAPPAPTCWHLCAEVGRFKFGTGGGVLRS